MSIMRSVLLAGSRSVWLRKKAPNLPFVRRTTKRFMPGEALEDALEAARELQQKGLSTIFTKLGENITEASEGEQVRDHYLDVLKRIQLLGLPTEISVKLTQLGLDQDADFCHRNMQALIETAGEKNIVWIDMEDSSYVDVTLDLYRRLRAQYANVGVCLQAYLYRTPADLESLIPMGPAIRLVKGAYKEPPNVAYPKKADVNEAYYRLATTMIGAKAQEAGMRAGIGTHDKNLIRRISDFATAQKLSRSAFQFQMLYGIQRAEQMRLVQDGWRAACLISYGEYWFPWFMRRLAERPANVMFIVKSMFTK